MNSRPSWRNLSPHDFRSITQKGAAEIFLVSRYVYRPISYHITRLYARLGVGADAATIHGVLTALASAAALLWAAPTAFLIAAAGLQIYFVLDHVDGELARLDDWRGVKPLGPTGLYLDFWAHFHSLNLVFGALGVGLSVHTGNVIWAVLGLLADNTLGNFPRLALTRTLWSLYRRDASVVRHPAFEALLNVAADVDVPDSSPGQTDRRESLLRVREFLFFPGCLVALSLFMTIDAVASVVTGRFSFALTGSYLALFVIVGIVTKIRRTLISLRQLNALVPNAQHQQGAYPSTP